MLRVLISLLMFTVAAEAQTRRPSHCIAIADAAPGLQYLHKAAYDEPVEKYSVRITYIEHAMFLLQTHGGLGAVTDYSGFIGDGSYVPDVVTMNHAHSTHFTHFPDPRIPNVLRGWGESPLPADHYLDLGEMLIRNVATDIRSRFGGPPEVNGNSIFIFEVEGLCVGHLGHLHHEPTDAQYAAIGRLDVVMAAVDGGMTVPTTVIVRILKRLKSSVVIPMHWFGRFTLDQFLAEMTDEFEILQPGEHSVEISLATLPKRPSVLVLEPLFLPSFDE